MTLRAGQRVAILTSGGDAPGMNCAIRAAARVGTALGLEMVGIEDGYSGLLDARLRSLDPVELDEAARRGGTILGTARSKVFPTPDGQARARASIERLGLAGIVVIGGNGSLAGARTLLDVKTATGTLAVMGVPASIDNDLACTSMAIGVDTAMNTIVEACDRIADTATAHKRTFLIEVMGRDCGYLAMTAAVAGGADVALVPEVGKSEQEIVDQVVSVMDRAYTGHRKRVIVLKAEGVRIDSVRLKAEIDGEMARRRPEVETRVTVLGHVVRGGAPTAFDRLLASRLAHAAVRAMADGITDMMAGWVGPGVGAQPSPYDPYVAFTAIPTVLAETAKLMHGDSPLAQWRRKVFSEIEPILAQ